MIVLRLAVFFMAFVTVAGSLTLVALLTDLGISHTIGIIGSVVVGLIAAVPAAYIIADKMSEGMQG